MTFGQNCVERMSEGREHKSAGTESNQKRLYIQVNVQLQLQSSKLQPTEGEKRLAYTLVPVQRSKLPSNMKETPTRSRTRSQTQTRKGCCAPASTHLTMNRSK